MSESTIQDAERLWLREFGKSLVVRGFASALVGGTRQAAYVRRLGIPPDRIFLGYASVDNAYFESRAAAVRQRADEERRRVQLPEWFFLTIARFVTKKNLPNLLRAFAEYRRSVEPSQAWSLVLVGDGPLRGELAHQSQQLGLQSGLHLPGFCQYDELPTYYGLAGAFVHASSSDQWGLVVNEAMASGLPVLVSHASGCAPDLVHEGVNGFAFDPENTHQLALLMARLAAAECPRAEMGEASRRIVRAWRPEQFAQSLWDAAKVSPCPVGRGRRFLTNGVARLANRFSGAWQ